MKAISALALASALLFAPNLFAETYIPWHWDDEAAMNGVDEKESAASAETPSATRQEPVEAK